MKRRHPLPGQHPASHREPTPRRRPVPPVAVRLVADLAAIALGLTGQLLAIPGQMLVWLARVIHDRWGG